MQKDQMTWDQRAKAVFAQGCNTYSKRSDQYVEGAYPTHCDDMDLNGMGLGPRPCLATCVEGGGHRLLVDYVCGLGSNLIDIRNNFSLPTTLEVLVAEQVKALFPCIEKLRILKTGSDACSAAVRIARAFTGREEVWGSGYHGWHNWTISQEEPGKGCVPEMYRKFPTLDSLADSLGVFCNNLAAVIVEPVQLDMNVEPQLKEIRRICTRRGIVLIFDEVISGFRVPKYSFSNLMGIEPDILCLGKALGSGYPLAIVGGREDIMETPGYFISSTHNGEASALREALHTLDFLNEQKLLELWARGNAFREAFNSLSPKIRIAGYATRGELQGEETFKALFMQEMVKRGYFFGRAWFITFAHTTEILAGTVETAAKVVKDIEAGRVRLEGQLPRPVFRRNP